MPVDISERRFEAQIEHVLRNQHGYHKRLPEDYHRDHCLIPQDVISFIQGTQPDRWSALRAIHKDEAETLFLRRLAREIHRRGTLDVLRNGVHDFGEHFRLIYYRPASKLNPGYTTSVSSQYLFCRATTTVQSRRHALA